MVMSLEAEALDRIVEAVGKRFVPTTLDRTKLQRAIESSEKRADMVAVNRDGARARNRLNKLKKIREAAEQLALLLNVNDDAVDMIVGVLGETPKWQLTG